MTGPVPPWRFRLRDVAPLLAHARGKQPPPGHTTVGLWLLPDPWPHLVSAGRPPDLVAFHGALPIPRAAWALGDAGASRPQTLETAFWTGNAPEGSWFCPLDRIPRALFESAAQGASSPPDALLYVTPPERPDEAPEISGSYAD